MKEVFAVASLGLSLIANIPYVFEIVKGKARPERISWLLWTILGVTYYLTALFEDGATFFTFGELIGPVIILLLSLKSGVGGRSRFDKYSLALASIAFGLLFVVDGVLISLALALFVDAIGIVLTMRKLLADPASESKSFWGIAFVSSVLAVLSLNNYTVETMAFPVYVIIVSALIFIKTNPAHEQNVKQIEKF